MNPLRSLCGVASCAVLSILTFPAAAAEEQPIECLSPLSDAAIELVCLDVVFAIDTSTNAIAPSGADIDGDGRIATQRFFLGFLPIRPKPADSLLAAELRAIRSLLEGRDPRMTRVGVIAYAGDASDAARRGSEQVAPLTHDYDQIRTALAALARRGPSGLTDLSGGIDRATMELTRAVSAEESAERMRVMVLLSDGRPTLPHLGDPVTNRSESVAAAQRAARADVRILVFGIGPEPFEPLLRQIADASKGAYALVENHAQIDVFSGLRAALEDRSNDH
jgi:hypothetical protein